MPAYNNTNNSKKKHNNKQTKQKETKKESKQKHGAEYSRILNVSEAVQITEQLSETYSAHCQTLMMEHFAKRIIPECRCATRNFSG